MLIYFFTKIIIWIRPMGNVLMVSVETTYITLSILPDF
jgi:hypothetical protein